MNGEDLGELPYSEALPSEEALAVDRELACLDDMATLWAYYLGLPAFAKPGYAKNVETYFAYALGALGPENADFLTSALAGLDWTVVPSPAPSPSVNAVASLASAKSPYSMDTLAKRTAAVAAMHRDLRDAYAANLPGLVAAVAGGCAEGCRPMLGVSEVGNSSVIAACIAYHNACQIDRVWRMYLATGDIRFYNVVRGYMQFFFATFRARFGDAQMKTSREFLDYFLPGFD